MTTTPQTPADNKPQPVTLERVTETMRGFGIQLWPDPQGAVVMANLNGFSVTFAPLGGICLVRADCPTQVASDSGLPHLYLAANAANCTGAPARAAVMDRTDKLVVRTECEISAEAGLSNAQLAQLLRDAVDAVLSTQDAVANAAESLTGDSEDPTA
ncbi:YbjN domain-containing protein [Corynebacterium uberis]|uniref:YbjN domain-containing protein n=1 Tax=Corynebacterium TaxID=1716 RepID=UPI001D0B14FE|nr:MULTISPECIES: YbjN domain-containing protein [Corynebacterium]MCZ9308574.1 YbjN domain-containing protein [Corynebacterium sp. c6VSa_13]UDL74224.1 YbjN domain-containing protein [Corynebacterium uberis]UDL74896.1 YbjN domain-containing protein [Corynebacterium uberis]UDL77110.1 YbjN domain-containing protein [Corynebacterium uberis]UDL79393.1 YbjN domain-containing protein [Corynebacterium uberis]